MITLSFYDVVVVYCRLDGDVCDFSGYSYLDVTKIDVLNCYKHSYTTLG